jgi:hypothetical protein
MSPDQNAVESQIIKIYNNSSERVKESIYLGKNYSGRN